jgi:predicted transcriptional regulator
MHEQWETGKTPTNVLLHVVYPVKIESSTVQTWRRERFRSEKELGKLVKIESSTVQTWRRERFQSEKELGKQQRYGTIVEEEVFEIFYMMKELIYVMRAHDSLLRIAGSA